MTKAPDLLEQRDLGAKRTVQDLVEHVELDFAPGTGSSLFPRHRDRAGGCSARGEHADLDLVIAVRDKQGNRTE